MKRLIILILLAPIFGFAQQVQYAAKVLKYSSDLGGKLNSVKRILGKPDAFPQGGPSANAWVAKDALGTGYVEVEFEKAQSVKQIAVFENLNAGCVSRVQVADASGKFRTVAKKQGNFVRWISSLQAKANNDRVYYFNKKRRKIGVAEDVSHNADINYFILDREEQGVKMVRIDFNFGLKPGQKQVDAIAISDSEDPIQPLINHLQGAESLSEFETLVSYALPDYDIQSLQIMGNKLYYTLKNLDRPSEIYEIDLATTKALPERNLRFTQTERLSFLFGYSPESNLILMGAEYGFRRPDDPIGISFYHYEEGKDIKLAKPLKITAYNNYGDYTDMFLTPDGKKVVLGIESDLTQGGFDLYFAEQKDENTFGLMQNFGKSINTAGDEGNPFLLSDQKTLLFVSNGYSGYGDFDIYVSQRLDDTWRNWSEPKNLGKLINGSGYESSPVYDEKSERLYFCTYEDGQTKIKRVKIPIHQLTTTN